MEQGLGLIRIILDFMGEILYCQLYVASPSFARLSAWVFLFPFLFPRSFFFSF